MMANSDNGDLNLSSSASDTNDPNNSFMKKVTKHVSGLIPTSLSRWFGPSERDTSVRRRISRDEEEEEEDESVQAEPPKKRAKLPTDSGFGGPNSYAFTSSTPLVNSRTDLRHLQPGPSGYKRHQTSSATQSEAPRAVADVVVNGDDKSDSEESAECSALPSKKTSETPYCFEGNTTDQPQISKTALNKSLNTSLNSSRSLFSEYSLNPKKPCLSSRRPSFNVSTFGSPSFVDRTLTTNRAVNSPFYGRRTIYGGASAYKKNRLIFPRDESNNITAKTSIEVKPVNEKKSDSESMHLSQTARRILDVLESFSTPVSDARKIPPITRPIDKATPSTSRQAKTPYSRETKPAPKTPLIVPGVPDLLKMKERLQESTEQVRKVATTSKSVLNSEYTIRKKEDPKPQKHVSKMRAKIGSHREKQTEGTDTIDAVNLPEVKLPITSLPKFDFTLPPPPLPTVTKPAETVNKLPEMPKHSKAPSTLQYKFADPIIICTSPKITNPINNFKFSEPLSSNNKQNPVATNASPSFTFKTFESSTAPKKRDSQKNNGQNSELGFVIQPPKELVQGSVMDILGKPEKKQEKSDNLMDKFKPAAGSWECTMCMVRNIATATRCVACETPKEPPKKKVEAPPAASGFGLQFKSDAPATTSTGFGAQFKMPADKWECSVCMVRNNNTDTKCVACTTPKPGANPAPSATAAASPFTFKSPNNKNATNCVASDTDTKSSTSKLLLPPETKQTSGGFADFIKKQQAETWECTNCMVRNNANVTKCACCESAKPGMQPAFKSSASESTTQFKFGIDKTSSGFSFGIPKSDAAPTSTAFTFGVKAEKQPETKIATVAPTTGGFTFGIPPAVSKSDSKVEATVQPFVFSPPKVVASTTSTSSTTTGSTSTSIAPTVETSAFKISTPNTSISTTTLNTPSSDTTSVSSSTLNTSTFSTPTPVAITSTSILATSSIPVSKVTPLSSTLTTTNILSSKPSTSIVSPLAPSSSTSISQAVKPQTISFGSTTTAATTSSTFSFGAGIGSAQNASPKLNFSFGTPTTTASTTSVSSSLGGSTSSATFTVPTTKSGNMFSMPVASSSTALGNIFGNTTTTAAPTVKDSTKTAAPTTTFSFEASSSAKPAFGVPQFNFGSGGLPFNPASATATTTSATQSAAVTSTSNSNTQNNQSFMFNFQGGSTAPVSKPEAKGGFSFTMSDSQANSSTFAFQPNKKPTAAPTPAPATGPAPLAKAVVFNFGAGASSETRKDSFAPATTTASSTFEFVAPKSESPFGVAAPSNAPSVFSAPAQSSAPQNGGFNFGSTAPAPNFNFPATNNTNSTGLFAFGGGQAGSGSTSSGSEVFTFGGASTSTAQQVPTFSPDVKPNFNFTGGAIPSFTAPATWAPTANTTGRRLRKAVRRVQPR